MPKTNPEEYFPELNIHILKVQAERWAKKFSEAPIKRILLYNYSPKYEGLIIARHGGQPLPIIYAIVFELDAEDKTRGMRPEEHLKYDLDGVNGLRAQEPYERLLAATKPNKRIADKEQYYDLMTQDFRKVYKYPPKPNYREEWHFYVKFKNTDLNGNVRTDEPHIVLWPQDQGNEENKHQENEENIKDENRYIFKQTGPTWRIVYEGRLLDGLQGKGFPYLHYLVQRPLKKFHVRELDIAIYGSNPEAERDGPKRRFWENDDFEDGYEPKGHAPQKSMDASALTDSKTIKNLKQKLRDYEEDIKEAEDLQNTLKAEQLKNERDEIKEYIKECFYSKDGKIKQFKESSIKQKTRICRRIQRAINVIAKYDRAAATHFQQALAPVNSFYLSYAPDREIDWSTH